jgi:hypothetical protein
VLLRCPSPGARRSTASSPPPRLRTTAPDAPPPRPRPSPTADSASALHAASWSRPPAPRHTAARRRGLNLAALQLGLQAMCRPQVAATATSCCYVLRFDSICFLLLRAAVIWSVLSVNTETEPKESKPNDLGIGFCWEPIGTTFLRNQICIGTEEPNRSVRYYRTPMVRLDDPA